MSKQEETVTFLGISNRTGDALSMTIALLLFLVTAILEVHYHSQIDKLGGSFINDFAQGRIDIKLFLQCFDTSISVQSNLSFVAQRTDRFAAVWCISVKNIYRITGAIESNGPLHGFFLTLDVDVVAKIDGQC